MLTLQWLTVSLCVPFPHTPLRNQNSRKRHLTGRMTGRQRMEGYQVWKKQDLPPLFFSTSTSSTLKLSGIDLKVEKPLEPSSVVKKLLCGEEHIYKTNYMCVRGWSRSHSCVPSVSLTKTFCFTMCLFMSDLVGFVYPRSDSEEWTDILCALLRVWGCVFVFTHLAKMGGAECWRLPWRWVSGQNPGRSGGLQNG